MKTFAVGFHAACKKNKESSLTERLAQMFFEALNKLNNTELKKTLDLRNFNFCRVIAYDEKAEAIQARHTQFYSYQFPTQSNPKPKSVVAEATKLPLLSLPKNAKLDTDKSGDIKRASSCKLPTVRTVRFTIS